MSVFLFFCAMIKKKVFVVGGGPAGLMAAWSLAGDFEVHLFEKEKMCGQKFLVAGKGGLNLTKNLPYDAFISNYTPAGFLNEAIRNFDAEELRKWFGQMNIPTFVGSSGKVFPEKGISSAQVLKAILEELDQKGVIFHLKHRLESFTEDMFFVFESPEGKVMQKADFAVFAFGGASWPQTGSDGEWVHFVHATRIKTNAFQPSNCGVQVKWPDSVKQHHEGKPLKNIELSVDGQKSRGEALITSYGLEGSAVYGVVPALRARIQRGDDLSVFADFKPFNTLDSLLSKLPDNIKPSTKEYIRLFSLNGLQMALIKAFSEKESFSQPSVFVQCLKKLSIPVEALQPLAEAISSAGGLDLKEVNADFSLKKYPRIYVAGEMLDWDAPTGGFLLQGCFAGGRFAAKAILKKK